jgi:hypothetical protein
MSGVRRGRAIPRRLLPSYFLATSRRDQRNNVCGVHQRVDLRQRLASELLRSGCEPTSLGVRVANASAAKLFAQHCVLGKQVLGDALLVSGHPSGQGQERKLQRQARHHRERSSFSGSARGPRNRCHFGEIDGWHITRERAIQNRYLM